MNAADDAADGEEWIAMPSRVFTRTLGFWMLCMWALGAITGAVGVVVIYTARELWG